jgi:hypothetical protein
MNDIQRPSSLVAGKAHAKHLYAHWRGRSCTNFATVAAINAKSEPLEHNITSAGSPNKALVGAL